MDLARGVETIVFEDRRVDSVKQSPRGILITLGRLDELRLCVHRTGNGPERHNNSVHARAYRAFDAREG